MNANTPKAEFVATLVAGSGAVLDANFLDSTSSALSAVGVEWLTPTIAADIFCNDTDLVNLQLNVKKLVGDKPYDFIVQKTATRRKKFLIADMESTIIEQEMLDELADLIGLRDKVATITRRAMNGELDFTSALRERVALLDGQPASMLDEVAKRITYSAGAKELVATMKANGAQCWLVSGGFTCFVEPVAKALGFDRFYANTLLVDGDTITGFVADPILDKNSKQQFLEQACDELNLSPEDSVAVGDGANDIPMLETCAGGGGLGVAYEAKPNVRDVIPQQINHSSLMTLLYAQGLVPRS
jgi:phosphoserine phosphatase